MTNVWDEKKRKEYNESVLKSYRIERKKALTRDMIKDRVVVPEEDKGEICVVIDIFTRRRLK